MDGLSRLPLPYDPETVPHLWECVCGQSWFDLSHQRLLEQVTGRVYLGKPGKIEPHRQWIAEQCPAKEDGFVYQGDDGFAVCWASQPKSVLKVEWEVNNREVGWGERKLAEDC